MPITGRIEQDCTTSRWTSAWRICTDAPALDEQYTRCPFYGVLRMTAWLRQQGHQANAKRARRLLRQMGLMAIYPRPRLSQPGTGRQLYPYLLTGVMIDRSDEVWSTDITYVRLAQGFVYLVAIMDWYSRYVLSWEVSVTLDSSFCVSALERALTRAQPEIFNSDQRGPVHEPGLYRAVAGAMDFASAWMDVGESSTTSLWSGYGAV